MDERVTVEGVVDTVTYKAEREPKKKTKNRRKVKKRDRVIPKVCYVCLRDLEIKAGMRVLKFGHMWFRVADSEKRFYEKNLDERVKAVGVVYSYYQGYAGRRTWQVDDGVLWNVKYGVDNLVEVEVVE